MIEFAGIINCVNLKQRMINLQTEFGEIAVECDDFRLSNAQGMLIKQGDHLSALNAGRYPEKVEGRTIFYIGDFTSIWVNQVLIPKTD